jgi:hypothetical protein
VLSVKVTNLVGLVPASGVSAVSLNVTASEAVGSGYITVYACGTRPGVSSLNYVKGGTTSNAVIVPVNPSTGSVCFFSTQLVNIRADIGGWFIATQ